MSHWYSADGTTLHELVPYADPRKGYRDATLSDARKNGWLPSVTSIIQALNKPGLITWQMQQVAEAAWQLYEPERDADWQKRVFRRADEFRDWTADFGTSVHEHLRSKLQNIPLILPPIMPMSEEVADGIIEWMAANGYEVELSEHRFARTDLGYAGSVDMVGTHNGKPAIWDIKTTEPPLTPHSPEWPLQLAGYDYALEPAWDTDYPFDIPVARERISLICNRLVPGQVIPKLWVDKDSTVQDTNTRWDKTWLQLVELWFSLSSYDPRVAE